jgi:hypothetical protein
MTVLRDRGWAERADAMAKLGIVQMKRRRAIRVEKRLDRGLFAVHEPHADASASATT